jgi:hypothetical protein
VSLVPNFGVICWLLWSDMSSSSAEGAVPSMPSMLTRDIGGHCVGDDGVC